MERYWLPHDVFVFVPRWLVETNEHDSKFVDDDGLVTAVKAEAAKSLSRVHDTQLAGVDDACTLEEVNEAAMLSTIRVRFERQEIYTRVSRILIAVNPFQQLPIYSSQFLQKYLQASESMDLPPHIFGIGLDALTGLRQNLKNQAVLISGESGAGKTECTKLVLSFVAESTGGGSGGVQDKILQINPVLEAFGNAMTVRNNNSSRFGKWLEIGMSSSLGILGCSVTDYLLELTRVCSQGPKERGYHIFFQLVQARNDKDLASLEIQEPSQYRYLQGSELVAPGVDDASCFEELKEALATLGFDAATKNEIFAILVGILTLGNCDFIEVGEAAQLGSGEEKLMERSAQRLGLEQEELTQAILKKRLTVGKEVTMADRSAAQARAARDGMAKLLYGQLFKWLINRMNKVLNHNAEPSCFFGVLDIAGFERFDHNSLEQLFINLSNEHLQQHFNNHIFKLELSDYAAEGISLGEDLSYQDNADIVALLGNPGGVLPMLDEEVTLMPRASDQSFVDKVAKAHSKHQKLVVPRFNGVLTLGVRHFAGEVTYSCEGFIEKNVDKPPEEAPEMLESSSLQILQELGGKMAKEQNEIQGGTEGRPPGSRGSRATLKAKAKTVSSGFRTSLTKLVDKLNEAAPHFVRCVKPNMEKVPCKCTPKLMLDQLICSGIMEAVRIRREGYPSRILFADFLGRFRVLAPKGLRPKLKSKGCSSDELLQHCQLLIQVLPAVLSAIDGIHEGEIGREILVAKSRVFAKTRVMIALEKSRDLMISEVVLDIQRRVRGERVRAGFARYRGVLRDLSGWLAHNHFYSSGGSEATALFNLKTIEAVETEVLKLKGILDGLNTLVQALPSTARAMKLCQRMECEVSVANELQSSLLSTDPTAISKALAQAKDLDILFLDDADVLKTRVQTLEVQLPLVQAMRTAVTAQDSDHCREVLAAVKKEGLDTRPEQWIREVLDAPLELIGEAERIVKESEMPSKSEEPPKEEMITCGPMPQPVEKSIEDQTMPKRSSERRKTITRIPAERQDGVLAALDESVRTYDADGLQNHLSAASQQGLAPEDLQLARDLLTNLQTSPFVINAMQEVGERLRSRTGEAQLVKAMQNLMRQAEVLGVGCDELVNAKTALQQGLRQRARATIHGRLFDDMADVSALQLPQDPFSNLAHFPGLVSAAEWEGHKSSEQFGEGGKGAEAMLRHSRNELRGPLTKLPLAHQEAAVRNFHNILGWMGDRPLPECQRLGYAQDIANIARSDSSLRDEIYVQVLKQLTDNPSQRSTMLGWKLLLVLCQQVSPSTSLDEFLRSFLIRAMSDNDEIAATAKQCVVDLNIVAAPERMQQIDGDLVEVQVLLIDNSTRKAFVPSKATLGELGKRIAEKLGVHGGDDFCFFQMTGTFDTHRMLPRSTLITMLLKKWDQLKQVSGQESKLLYKRCTMRKDEILLAGDRAHANLTYRQALWDYLHYPVQEEPNLLCEIAATLLCNDRDHYADYLTQGHLPEILKQVLPERALCDQSLEKWSRAILQTFEKLHGILDAQETQILKMSRVFSLLQQMALFGSQFWLGRQVAGGAVKHVPLKGPIPTQVCQLDSQNPDAAYWICVSAAGLRLMSFGSEPSRPVLRDFHFGPDADERLVDWGTSQNVLQLVVQVANAGMPGPSIKLALSLVTPAAADISYSLEFVSCEAHSKSRSSFRVPSSSMRGRIATG